MAIDNFQWETVFNFSNQISNKVKQKNEEFLLLDKAERDLFILMQSSVKTSHEKEKIHTNSAKYWSIVGSLVGKLPRFG